MQTLQSNNKVGKRTVLATKFAEKDSFVFVKKKGHFCHINPTSVN